VVRSGLGLDMGFSHSLILSHDYLYCSCCYMKLLSIFGCLDPHQLIPSVEERKSFRCLTRGWQV